MNTIFAKLNSHNVWLHTCTVKTLHQKFIECFTNSSVAEHWQLKPGALGSIPGNCCLIRICSKYTLVEPIVRFLRFSDTQNVKTCSSQLYVVSLSSARSDCICHQSSHGCMAVFWVLLLTAKLWISFNQHQTSSAMVWRSENGTIKYRWLCGMKGERGSFLYHVSLWQQVYIHTLLLVWRVLPGSRLAWGLHPPPLIPW